MSGKILWQSPNMAMRSIALAYRARVPVNLVGAPGCGKTSAVEAFASVMAKSVKGFRLWTYVLSQKDVADFGVPQAVADTQKLRYFFPEDIPLGDPKAKGVLFLDEWDRCNDPGVQGAALQLTLGGHFHGAELSRDVFTVLAMNGTSDIMTSAMSEAARTRMAHIYVGPDPATKGEAFFKSWQDWAQDDDRVSIATREFVRFRPDLLVPDEVQFEELARANMRTVAMADRLFAAADEVKFEVGDILPALICGTVGHAMGLDMLAHRQCAGELVDPDEVLANPGTAPVPKGNNALFVMSGALLARMPKEAGARQRAVAMAIVTYVKRWPAEVARMATDRLTKEFGITA